MEPIVALMKGHVAFFVQQETHCSDDVALQAAGTAYNRLRGGYATPETSFEMIKLAIQWVEETT